VSAAVDDPQLHVGPEVRENTVITPTVTSPVPSALVGLHATVVVVAPTGVECVMHGAVLFWPVPAVNPAATGVPKVEVWATDTKNPSIMGAVVVITML